MKKLILIFMVCVPFIIPAQDFRANSNRSLFSDYKASRLGDVVTIIVVEASQATNATNLSAGRKSDIGFNASANMGGTPALPKTDFGIGSKNNFSGGGKSSSSGIVKTKISAVIDSVYDNGLLRIAGTRKIIVNGEEQLVTIKGLIRSADLQTDNSVYSYKISDAEIIFKGDGRVTDSTSPGFLTKFFHWLF